MHNILYRPKFYPLELDSHMGRIMEKKTRVWEKSAFPLKNLPYQVKFRLFARMVK